MAALTNCLTLVYIYVSVLDGPLVILAHWLQQFITSATQWLVMCSVEGN